MKNLTLIASALLLGLMFNACEHRPGLNNYRWILGEWEVKGKDTATYEFWEEISDTLYEGINFIVHEEDTFMREHLWLESRAGKVMLSAKVYGHNEDRRIFFTNTLKTLDKARFENKEHDFPTVIQYRKSGTHFLEATVCNDTDTNMINMHKIEV